MMNAYCREENVFIPLPEDELNRSNQGKLRVSLQTATLDRPDQNNIMGDKMLLFSEQQKIWKETQVIFVLW